MFRTAGILFEILPTQMTHHIGHNSLNMPDFWPHFVSGEDLRNPKVDLFHIAHTQPLGGVDVPFGFFEIRPT